MAAALKGGEQRALGYDRGASFGVVELLERVCGFSIRRAAFYTERTLTYGGHADLGRKRLADAMRPAETIEPGFGEHDGVVLTGFHFA